MEKKCEKKDCTTLVREKAHELWEKDGCKQGRDMDYWLRAEKIVKSQVNTKQECESYPFKIVNEQSALRRQAMFIQLIARL